VTVAPAAGKSPGTCAQLGESKWLHHAVVCAEIETFKTRFDLVASAEDKDGQVVGCGAENTQHLGSVETRKVEVKDGEIGSFFKKAVDGGLPVPGEPNFMAVGFKTAPEKCSQRLIVFRYEKAHCISDDCVLLLKQPSPVANPDTRTQSDEIRSWFGSGKTDGE